MVEFKIQHHIQSSLSHIPTILFCAQKNYNESMNKSLIKELFLNNEKFCTIKKYMKIKICMKNLYYS